MKEAVCNWYSKAKEQLEELNEDIRHFENNQNYRDKDSIYFRYDYKLALFGVKTDWSLKGKSYELKSDISMNVIIGLLKHEKSNLEWLMDGISDKDIDCNRCKRIDNCNCGHCLSRCSYFEPTQELIDIVIRRRKEELHVDLNESKEEKLEKLLREL